VTYLAAEAADIDRTEGTTLRGEHAVRAEVPSREELAAIPDAPSQPENGQV